jgi:hypothetical protein
LPDQKESNKEKIEALHPFIRICTPRDPDKIRPEAVPHCIAFVQAVFCQLPCAHAFASLRRIPSATAAEKLLQCLSSGHIMLL